MTLGPTYLPPIKQKNNTKRNIILLGVFLLVIVSIIIAYIFLNREHNGEVLFKTHVICDLDPRDQQQQIEQSLQEDRSFFADYLIYGEELSFYQNKYDQNESDPYIGKTIQFRDMCSDEVHSFLQINELDSKIPLQDLPEGFYQVYIQQNVGGNRLASPTVLDQTFTTVTRNGKRKQIRLIADKSYFTDIYTEELLLENNDLFVEVKEIAVDNTIVDIMLDGAGNHQDFGPTNLGKVDGDFIEANETYRFVEDLKKALEAKGLVVGTTRANKDLIVNTYGEEGRVYQAMNAQAKYMIEYYFEEVYDSERQGSSAYGSRWVSKQFQQALMEAFNSHQIPIYIGSAGQEGVFTGFQLRGQDGSNILRESGGKALGAGNFSERSDNLNQFAVNNPVGVHTINVNLMLVSNPNYKQHWDTYYQAMIDASVEGILEFLGVQP